MALPSRDVNTGIVATVIPVTRQVITALCLKTFLIS